MQSKKLLSNKSLTDYFISSFFWNPLVIVVVIRNFYLYNKYFIFAKERFILSCVLYKASDASFFLSLSAKTKTSLQMWSGSFSLFFFLLSLFMSDLSLLPESSFTLFNLWKSNTSLNSSFSILFSSTVSVTDLDLL